MEKLLAVVLALLLGFSPLQATWASTAATADQQAGFQQSMSGQGKHLAGQLAEPQHESCCQGHDCCEKHSGNSHCGFVHCASCLTALVVSFSPPTPAVVASTYGISDTGSPSQHHRVILRPPKA
jgi:hypothetical protein